MTKKISARELAKLAAAVGNMTTIEKARTEGTVEGWSFLDDPKIRNSGFKAATYKNNATGEIAIVYGGSDDLKDLVYNDTAIALNKTVPQATEAIRYYESITSKYNLKEVAVTGHSLGGALTDYVAYYAATTLGDNTTQFTTFNAPGIQGNKFTYNGRSYTVETNGGILLNIDEFRIDGESIGGYGKKLGNDICLNRVVALSAEDAKKLQFIIKNYNRQALPKYALYFLAKCSGHTMEEYLDAKRWNKNNEMLGICLEPKDIDYKNGVIYWLGTETNWGMAWDGMDPLNPFGAASTLRKIDPIVLDLNGDGITFGAARDGYAQFDLDNNGFKERVAWLNGQDGFLVRDINGNGSIDNGTELFGDRTILKNGKTATSGYAALKELDDNQDGVLDKLDKAFVSLKIWQDKDGDGVTDDGELGHLTDLGITGINLGNEVVNRKDDNNNTLHREGSYTKEDATKGAMGEYFLGRDTVHSETVSASDEEYSDEINTAPNLAGQGNVVDLHRAMAEDGTGDLYKYVQKFIAATRSSEKMDWLDKILFKWTGTEKVNKNSRGSYADAQKLGTLEKLYGQDFVNVYGDSNPNYQNIWEELNKQYVSIRYKAYAQLAMQTFAKEVCDNLKIVYTKESDGFKLDATGVREYIDKQLTVNEETAVNSFKNLLAVVKKMGWQDEIAGLTAFIEPFKVQGGAMEFFAAAFMNNLNFLEMGDLVISARGTSDLTAIFGNKEDNSITGSSVADILYGGAGNDRLYGNAGDDILSGGLGDDYLKGGDDRDTYVWNKGDGNDTIDAYNYFSMSNKDRLLMERINQAIELNASKKTAFALSITTTMIVTLAGILGIREYTQGKIEDIDSLLGSFCEAKQKEWNSKELEPWEKMLNSIYHMDGGFNLTKALNEFLEGKLSLWQSNKMEKWGKMLNAMYLCEGCDMDNPYGKASTIHFVDPLVVDLDGDGITFSSAKDGYAQFDMDKSGFKERVAWLNNSDGFLARDINNNGIIDDGSELFGDRTALKNGGIAANGFSALQDLDDNKDGILDKLDKFFASLCIWQDKDGDGITDTGELTSLAAAGISSLGLNETNINSTDKNGNILDKTSLYTRTDGSQGTIGEFSLGKDTVHSIAVDRTTKEYSHKIQDAPNLLGQGNVVALHRAMAEDATGDL